MPRLTRLLLPFAAVLALAGAGPAAPEAEKPDVRAQIAKRLDIKVEDVRPSPVTGLYEVTSGAEVGYVSADGRFYVDGDVFDMNSKHNLTEDKRKVGRLALLAGEGRGRDHLRAERHGAAHGDRLHRRRLRPLPAHALRDRRAQQARHPRALPQFSSRRPGQRFLAKAEAVWCSADRKDALTRAKKGETLPAGKCESPVAVEYELGRQIGISGTPGIVTETGEFLAGYASAAYLAEYLSAPAATTAAK